ncbi:MAG TPA: hypothetical protein VKB94_08955 [Rhizomicrobium sp.]|nr:hypothetical protein [Rhizomicrobium sp.]
MKEIQDPRAAGTRPDFFAHRADGAALEEVFASLGRASVHHLVSAPHPFGLPPNDRLAAMRWLSRAASARQREHELTTALATVLAIVALGLALGIALLSISPAESRLPGPGDGVRKSQASMRPALD